MTPAAILAELRTSTSELPEGAILAAMEEPQAIIPGLLDILAAALADPEGFMEDPEHTSHLVALFLLAQFREPRALPPLLAMLRLPEEQQDELLGDFLTEGLASVLASLCADDASPLEAMAADATLDLYVRNAAMDALLALGFQKLIPEARFEAGFEALLAAFEARGKAEDTLAWANLASSCAIAGFTALLPRLREAYAQGLVEEAIIDLEELETSMTRHQAHYHRRFLKDHHTVEDALLELEERPWLLAPEEPVDEDETCDLDEEDDDEEVPAIPALAPATRAAVLARQGHPTPDPARPSRNAPCPCGSGKKYKRCCGKD